MKDIYQTIAEKRPSMSKSHLKVANYILDNRSTVPFFTVGKLAELTGVSDATVFRFATTLGFSGYNELQQYLQDSMHTQLTAQERMKMSNEIYHTEDEKGVYEIFQDDIANIQSSFEKLDLASFKKSVQLMLDARKIYIVANRSTRSLGLFMHHYLHLIMEDAELIRTADEAAEKFLKASEKDLVIGLSFSRYSKKTIDIFSFAKEKGIKTIAITDNSFSPLLPGTEAALTVSTQMPSFIDSYTAPLSLINALINYIGRAKEEKLTGRLDQLEKTWEKFDTFYK
ncbi:MurR/RpiR family transcriptional regulator [Halobacillus sp. Marseille-Q1614]|uniref:MurR/RpiR family transcriptional regulator n=1 Tax=Halobacillus sp. Marseille-Q1614 TaxID=2709134 RepID=UPI001570AA3F|nr:MurR/RpiR family transcriptional regulator [Halobacillus sp. Marseille-Q1614]